MVTSAIVIHSCCDLWSSSSATMPNRLMAWLSNTLLLMNIDTTSEPALTPNRIAQAFTDVAAKIELMCSAPSDRRLLLLLCGRPGIGKTETIRRALKAHGQPLHGMNPRNIW